MWKINFRNRSQSLIGVIAVLIVVGLISGGLYYYFSKQIPEIPEITKKPIEEEIVKPESGLIVIKKGIDGENFAKMIASSKGWNILSVDTSDHNKIKQAIVNFYNQKKFDYLLMIGTNEEIPYAIYDNEKNIYQTDPSLYADINDDGFIELIIGRLPFSSEEKLKKYYTDLEPKGNLITFNHYPFSYPGDPEDAFIVRSYTYAKSCLASFSQNIRAYRNANISDLINHYKESAVVELRAHGADDFSATGDESLSINSFCKDYYKLPSGQRPSECKPEYLSNRPIIIHISCNNGKILGRELIENGASAFMGFYNEGVYTPAVTQKILAGETIGEAVRKIYNSIILRFAYVWPPEWKGWSPGEWNTVPHIQGLNTFNVTDASQVKEIPFDKFGFILYGDPSLKLPSRFQKPNYNISVKQGTNLITIEAKSPKLLKVSDATELLCYAGGAVSDASFIIKEYWPNSHELFLIFPVTGINKLKSMAVIIDDRKITFNDFKNWEEGRINLLKGKKEQYLYLGIRDGSVIEGEISRLDYTKDIQILISYE